MSSTSVSPRCFRRRSAKSRSRSVRAVLHKAADSCVRADALVGAQLVEKLDKDVFGSYPARLQAPQSPRPVAAGVQDMIENDSKITALVADRSAYCFDGDRPIKHVVMVVVVEAEVRGWLSSTLSSFNTLVEGRGGGSGN